MTITLLVAGLVIGGLVGWLVSRPTVARLQTTIDKERAAHADRVAGYQRAEESLRDVFTSLSAQALNRNNEAFLALAETRLRQARSEATADVDARRKAIEDLLAPMAKTLERVDTEVREAERRRNTESASLLQRVAALDVNSRDLQAETRRLVDALKRPGVRGRWGELQLKRVVELAGMIGPLRLHRAADGGWGTTGGSGPTSSSGSPAGSTSSSTPRCRSTRTCVRSKRPTKLHARRCWPIMRVRCAHTSVSLATKSYFTRRAGQSGVRRHVPARRNVLQRGAGAGSGAHRVRRRPARSFPPARRR